MIEFFSQIHYLICWSRNQGGEMNAEILVNTKGNVTEVCLNRPEHLNAMNRELMQGLEKAFTEIDIDKTRAILLKGNGRGFCAGGDIRQFLEYLKKDTIPRELPDTLHRAIERIREIPVPVVAAVNGPCAGAGFSLTMACDLVLASDRSRFSLAYAKIGLSPDGGSTFFLPRHLGMKKAMEMFLLPEVFDAETAQSYGFVNRVYNDDEFAQKTREFVQNLASGPTRAFGYTKKLMLESWNHSLYKQLERESDFVCESVLSEDFRSGVEAFLNKSQPEFKGQ